MRVCQVHGVRQILTSSPAAWLVATVTGGKDTRCHMNSTLGPFSHFTVTLRCAYELYLCVHPHVWVDVHALFPLHAYKHIL